MFLSDTLPISYEDEHTQKKITSLRLLLLMQRNFLAYSTHPFEKWKKGLPVVKQLFEHLKYSLSLTSSGKPAGLHVQSQYQRQWQIYCHFKMFIFSSHFVFIVSITTELKSSIFSRSDQVYTVSLYYKIIFSNYFWINNYSIYMQVNSLF